MNAVTNFLGVVRRDRFLIACAAFVFVVVGLAWIGIRFTGYTYDQITDASLLQPSWAHWFGTDLNGHDLLTRTLYGAQISLLVAGTGALVSLTIGVAYGMISGYAGGRVDNLMMRLVEIAYSLPTLVLVIVFVTTLDDPAARLMHSLGVTSVSPRLVLIIVFLGLTEWFTMARIIRGQVLVLKEQQFVQASLALGQSHLRILWQHLLPNLTGISVVYLTLTIPAIMLDESFAGIFWAWACRRRWRRWGTLVSDAAGVD